MTECEFHKWMDSVSTYSRTLRCAHYGESHVHERMFNDLAYVDVGKRGRWINRHGGEHTPTAGYAAFKPELITVTVDTADAEFDAAVERMLADAPSIHQQHRA